MSEKNMDDRIQDLIDELKASRITPEEFTARLQDLMRDAGEENVTESAASPPIESEYQVDVDQVKQAAREARSL